MACQGTGPPWRPSESLKCFRIHSPQLLASLEEDQHDPKGGLVCGQGGEYTRMLPLPLPDPGCTQYINI